MTLSTYIGILGGKATAQEAYDFINSFLVPKGRTAIVDTEGYCRDDTKYLGNAPGQQFPAWLGIRYREDGPLFAEDHYDEYDDEEPYLTSKACDFSINFDTGYGYHDKYGGCADLHARYIIALNAWITAKGGSLWWKNEYSGEYFEGLNGLEEFASDGIDAPAWFSFEVKPAIESMVTESGGQVTWL